MATLLLTSSDVDRLGELLAGKDKPESVSRGTWRRLTNQGDIDCLELDELRAIAECEPRVITALGLPRGVGAIQSPQLTAPTTGG